MANFLGPQARLQGLDELEASRLWAENSEVIAAGFATYAAANADGKRAVLRQIGAALGGLDEEQAKRVLFAVQPGQVINDFNRYMNGPGSRRAPTQVATLSFLEENFSSGGMVLDAGCSIGHEMLEVADANTRMVGIDISMFALCLGDAIWKRTQSLPPPSWHAASILQLPFRDAFFTNVMSFVVLGLVPLRLGLGELGRVLKPGGQLIFTIEGPGFWRRLWDESPAFGWGRAQLIRWWVGRQLLRFGFQWREIRGLDRLAGLVQYSKEMLLNSLDEADFELERLEPLTEYRGTPSLWGITATRAR
ncbi:MAG TPA: methyltransferase domain-containing protein [Steroidobacteraceae bacterium]|nr:methyltransferase domain-containing protein [Steroidobacteraceae bacterium]